MRRRVVMGGNGNLGKEKGQGTLKGRRRRTGGEKFGMISYDKYSAKI